MDYLAATLEIKAVQAQQRIISGYAAGIGNQDRVQDVILPGAFAKTLTTRPPADVAVFIGHKTDTLPVGIPLTIRETPQGLYTETLIKPGPVGDDLLATAEFLQRHGRALGMSIGYRVPPGGAQMARGAAGKLVRQLSQIDLHEYSFAASQSIANEAALVVGVKQTGDAMPYHIEERDGQYCVVNPDSGRQHGCHATEAEAQAQMRALYANVPEASKQAPTWDADYLAALPDSAYLQVDAGEQEAGRTVPQSKRHWAYRDAEGKISRDRLAALLPELADAPLVLGRVCYLLAQPEAKLAEADTPEWQQGAAPALYAAAHRLMAEAAAIAADQQAQRYLGQDTHEGKLVRPERTANLEEIVSDLQAVNGTAKVLNTGRANRNAIASYRQRLRLWDLAS